MNTRISVFSQLDGFGMCDACWQEMKHREAVGRYGIWRRFPGVFGIEAKRWGWSATHPC
ncbi:hypothetical protein V8D89_006710 [Ganoderma adspersum]